jgi:N-acetylglucosaminyl-diphospho-decaprenol L-rhamnosyltransferase
MRRVLVIIVNYKSAALTVECVRSLETERKNLDLRIVVVENASGDAEMLREALVQDHVSLVVAERNGGFAYGNNVGIRFAYENGFVPDYFHLLNPDTRAYPGAVTKLVEFLDAHPDAGLAGSGIENGDGSDWPIAFRFPSLASEIDRGMNFGLVTKALNRWVVARTMGKKPQPIDWVPGASLMLRRELVEAVGGLDEQYFLYYEETDFCLKARRAGYSCWYVPDSRIVHIAGQSTGVTRRDNKVVKEPPYWFESRRRYFAKNYGIAYAALTDIAFCVATGLGDIKRVAKGMEAKSPHSVTQVLRHSPLFPKNRRLSPEHAYHPGSMRD